MPRTIWLAGLLALSLSACVETHSTHTNGNGGGANPPDSLDRVLSRTFTVPAFKLESGQVLPEMTGDETAIGVVSPAGRRADDECDGPALVKVIGGAVADRQHP